MPIFLCCKWLDKHPLKLLVRLTGIFNIMWLYVKGDQSGDWFVSGLMTGSSIIIVNGGRPLFAYNIMLC